MGVINLSVLVDKIKRKLLNSGFITSNDKASKSKFGIMKVGDGLTVSNGVVSSESTGFAAELIASYNSLPGEFKTVSLETGKKVSDYGYFIVETKYNNIYYNGFFVNQSSFKFGVFTSDKLTRVDYKSDTQLDMIGNTYLPDVKVYGIK